MANTEIAAPKNDKRCIFCGEPPTSKNKEHVIPKWLISLTGDPKRHWHLGVDTSSSDRTPRQFAADQYQFPACMKCNERYSNLEARTKDHIIRLLDGDDLTAAEWDDLLDWFDKVRIGLWIGNRMLNKDWPTPVPKFFIDQRLGKKDRCVLVYPNRSDFKGLIMSGASDPVFMYKPSAFTLTVNGLIFLNLSSELLFTQNMGLPYPSDLSYKDGRVYIDGYLALSEPKPPLLDFQFHPPQLAVYQSILIEAAMEDEDYARLVGSEYTRSRMIEADSTRAQICTLDGDELKFHKPDEKVVKRRLKKESMLVSREYYAQLYRYRQHDLDAAKDLFPDHKKLLEFLDQYNLGALKQAEEL